MIINTEASRGSRLATGAGAAVSLDPLAKSLRQLAADVVGAPRQQENNSVYGGYAKDGRLE